MRDQCQRASEKRRPAETKLQVGTYIGMEISQTSVYYCRWFCEGKELENSPDIQIINDGELHSLIISEAFEEDTGRYSCFASNVYGTDSTSAEIYVEGDALNIIKIINIIKGSRPQLCFNPVADEECVFICAGASSSDSEGEHHFEHTAQ